jgi:dTMP kinase
LQQIYTLRKNKFIAFEGIDGSGKSTQIKLLGEKLKQEGHSIYQTFEPTNNPIGKMIRAIFSGMMQADHRSIAALFVADRIEHVVNEKDGLLKMLREGFTVLTDRYYFSSYAYHSAYMPMDWVIEANRFSTEMLRPDLTIYIDIEAEISLERITKNRQNIELYESLENLKTVRNNYFEAFKKLQSVEKIAIINGNQTEEKVTQDIWEQVQKCL